MPTILEKIETSEEHVVSLDAALIKLRKEFMKDGEIDADEQKKLDKVKSKIKLADEKVYDLRNEFEANKAEWEGRAEAWADFKITAVELEDWGDAVAKDLLKSASEIETYEAEQQWKNATENLASAISKASAPAAERIRQLAFQTEYESRDVEIQRVYSDLQTSDFASAEDVRTLFDPVDTSVQDAASLAEAKTYDLACKEFEKTQEKLMAVGDAINAHQIQFETYTGKREAVDDGVASVRDREYQSEITQGAVTNIETNMPPVDAAAAAMDYASAIELLEIGIGVLNDAERDIAANDPTEQKTHKIDMPDGTTLLYTKAEYEAEVAKLCAQLKRGPLARMRSAVDRLAGYWDHFNDLRDDQYIVSFFVETFAGTDLPSRSIVTKAEEALKRSESAVDGNDLKGFTDSCANAEKIITDGMDAMDTYRDEVISSAETTVVVLEFTKTASFTFCAVFAAPVVGTVAGTGALGSAVIGGAAVAFTKSTASEIGNWAANPATADFGDAVSNILIDTGVGAVTGWMTKGGSGGTHVAESILSKVGLKVASQEGFKLLSAATLKNVTIYITTSGMKSAMESSVKNAGAALKGDPKMTLDKFAENVATDFLKGAALAPVGFAIEKVTSKGYDALPPAQRTKIEEFIGNSVKDYVAKDVSSKLTDDVHLDAFNEAIQTNLGGYARTYVGDMIKSKAGNAFDETLKDLKAAPTAASVEKAAIEQLVGYSEYDEALQEAAKNLAKVVESEIAVQE